MSIKKFLAVAAVAAMPVMATAGNLGTAPVEQTVDDPLPMAGSLGSSAAAPIALGIAALAVVAAAASRSSSTGTTD